MTNKKPLTPRQLAFAKEYIKTGVASEAYRIAYNPRKADASYCGSRGAITAKIPHVASMIEELRRESVRLEAFGITEVFRRWVDIATADVNDLVRMRIDCCRYCHGEDHKYQWTHAEYVERCNSAQVLKLPMPDCTGGFGFDPNRKPHLSCSECFGRGDPRIEILDTRDLKGKAKLLYKSAKNGKYGIEVELHDQAAALVNIAKHLGMFVERFKDETAPDAQSLTLTVTDPIEAAKIYQKIMQGS